MMVETASAVRLDVNIMSKYLLEAVVWKKDDSPVVFNENIFLTESKGMYMANFRIFFLVENFFDSELFVE